MKKYKDFTLHFTIKDQSLEDLKKKFYEFDARTLEADEVLVTESDEEELVLHHCFLPPAIVSEKGLPTEVLDFLDTVCNEQVRWYQATDSLDFSRVMMLRNLKRLGGVAIFLGEIKEGVVQEYELAKHIGIPCILIS